MISEKKVDYDKSTQFIEDKSNMWPVQEVQPTHLIFAINIKGLNASPVKLYVSNAKAPGRGLHYRKKLNVPKNRTLRLRYCLLEEDLSVHHPRQQ